jgi:DNA-binding GntR family transcriptional regulator
MTEAVYIELRNDIVSCRLKPGARVKIADLCARLGTNLSAVREALARLLADGLVVSEPQKGFQIAPVSTKDLSDLAFARLEIDLLCLRAALANASIDWESGLVAALHRIRRTQVHEGDDPNTLNSEFLRAAEQYFEAMMSSAGNEWLLRLRRQLYTQYERYRRLTMIGYANRDMYKEFSDLTDAALSGNVGLTETRLRDLISPTEQFLNSLMTKVDIAARTSKPLTQPKRGGGRDSQKSAPGRKRGGGRPASKKTSLAE